MTVATHLVRQIWAELGAEPSRLAGLPSPQWPVPLPSKVATADLAWASIATAGLAMGVSAEAIGHMSPAHIGDAYRSDRFLRIDGTPPDVWGDLSGFWRTRDGWIRTHANYPHHAQALRRGLGLSPNSDAVTLQRVLAPLTSREATSAISAAGGLAVIVAKENPSADAALRSTPLVRMGRTEGSSSRAPRPSLAGTRILDLTRVIAGPVCTRTLALFGADVLRVDPPELPEPEWQHRGSGHGKRSTRLSARSAEFSDLLAGAEVVVLGYRPSALERLGLSPSALIDRFPGLIVVQLSAWGTEHPDRAGFDSLVQAESGIAMIESPDGIHPGTLPAQALDHSAGYLLAAATAIAQTRAVTEGGSWIISTSLRRVAAELLGMPRSDAPEPGVLDSHPKNTRLAEFTVGSHSLVTVESPFPGHRFRAPRPWGSDRPRW